MQSTISMDHVQKYIYAAAMVLVQRFWLSCQVVTQIFTLPKKRTISSLGRKRGRGRKAQYKNSTRGQSETKCINLFRFNTNTPIIKTISFAPKVSDLTIRGMINDKLIQTRESPRGWGPRRDTCMKISETVT